MPQLSLYTSLVGTFVFNQNFYAIDKALFGKDELIRNAKLLEQGKLIDEEKKLIKKHSKGSFTIIGFKTEKIEAANTVFDREIFLKMSETMLKDDSILGGLRKANILVTKNDVKESVNPDILIIQAVSSIKELEKALNMLAKRLREWYSYYLPEFSASIEDHERFAELIASKDRNSLLKELGIKKDDSMGAEIGKEDLEQITQLAKKLQVMYALKKEQDQYLEKLMKKNCPNVQAVAGTFIGAKLLEQAGSLKRLVGFPSSTIQVLGAEEAFFRHMKTGSKMPKHGFISQHEFMSKVPQSMKGRIARALADKISIASKVDYFKGEFVGDMLRKKVEDRLKQGK